MSNEDRIKEVYHVLHDMPEEGLHEVRTSAFLAGELKKFGYEVHTGVGGTGVVGVLKGKQPGPVLALRADMDALVHNIEGKHCAIHSCGHDAHSAMVLGVAEMAAVRGIVNGTLKILFQPAEETLFGAKKMIEAGAIDDVDILLGIHLRPSQEAKLGQATPALYHGSSYIMEAVINGAAAHGARPHLGVNVIDAAAAAVHAVNGIWINPTVPYSAKCTKLHAGGGASNAIPDKGELTLDLRCQNNALMAELIEKATRAIEAGASTVGAQAIVQVKGGVPAAEYSEEIISLAKDAIRSVLGEEGLLEPITTPGGEDFHFYVKHKPSLKVGYVGLGCNLLHGLHHPQMSFDLAALKDGMKILSFMVEKIVGYVKD